ncbi:MAG: alanine racemase [Burkholderiaceae bacterium]|nr:alanine racemase [Burkholderiaceae bacterium]
MARPLIASIDVAAMQHNLSVAKSHAPQARTWAVVKANAYGHGLPYAVRGFAAADGLGLIEPDGAVRLRELGWQKPVLLLEGFFQPEDLPMLAQYQVQTAIHCNEQIDMLEQAALAAPIDVHLKMNTGMNRLGFKPGDFRAAYARLRAIAHVRTIGMMTHFANAEDADHALVPVAEQVRRFNEASAGLEGPRSLSNSAGDLLRPEAAADWVRPGIMLYGATPGYRTAEEFGLRPAMTLTGEIIGMQYLVQGDAVGYGSRFVAMHPITTGVVCCGYADGYPRHAPTGTPVLVDGVRTRTLGKISMDMLVVDLSAVPGARVGSKVTLWGEGLPIDEVARSAETIGYELMCAVAPRVRVIEKINGEG